MKQLLAFLVVLTIATGVHAQAGRGKPDDWFVTKSPPKATLPPKQLSSSELIPLGAANTVPESATERKRPPSPEYLMGKVVWGQSASIGKVLDKEDWNLAANDVEFLMNKARERGFPYYGATTRLTEFNYDPKRLPALMLSGVRPLKLTDAETKKLREYVLSGGTIICDSVYGSPYFYESALQVFNDMFPESRFRVLPADHPLYHMLVPIEKVTYAYGPTDDKPFLEAIYIGSRAGVLLSKNGLGCGWEANMSVFPVLVERGLQPRAYSVASARAIAENLAAYIIGYAQVGEIEGQPELFGLPDQRTPTAEFVFAQVKHDGAWNAHPGAARSLLLKLKQEKSSISVNLKRVAVDPAVDDLSAYPFLYMTGLDDFTLNNKAADRLKQYVEDGGTLVINNSLGLASFHQAVTRECGRIFPDKALKRLPADHAIYKSRYPITKVEYSPVLRKTKGDELQDRPALYGMAFGEAENVRIIYSPYDLEAGWNEVYYPLVRGYMPDSAQKLGMNIIVYSMTH